MRISIDDASPSPTRWVLPTAVFLLTFSVGNAGAQAPSSGDTPPIEIRVEKAVIAEGVENLIPVNPGTVFPADIGKVFCFTRIHTEDFPTRIKHLWFLGDTFVMEIILPVKSPQWRTYSSKTILPSSAGDWRVDVTTDDGTFLETLKFTIQ